MRPSPLLVLSAFLVLSQMFSFGQPASAQEATRDPAQVFENCVLGRAPTPQEEELVQQGLAVDWEGVCRPMPWDAGIDPPDDGKRSVTSVAVGLSDEFAVAPIEAETQLMVVVVNEGVFALDLIRVTEPGKVVAFAGGNEIPLLRWMNRPPYYVPTGDVVEDAQGQPCTDGCVLDPGGAYKLRAGDRIVVSPNTTCLYCLIGANDVDDGETGVLDVYAIPGPGELPETRTLMAAFDDYQSQAGTPVADASPAMGWAFLHPATRCRGGR